MINFKTKKTFKFIFVFTKLAKLLTELKLASLNNIYKGFGYNSRIILFTINNVIIFPFLVIINNNNKNLNQISPLNPNNKIINNLFAILSSFFNASLL